MNVVAIHLNNLTNADYVRYMRHVLSILENRDPALLKVEPEMAALTAKIDAIELVFKQDQASELTEVISNLDLKRDKYLVGIAGIANSYQNHYDESMVQAAKSVSHHINVYGKASGIGYEALPKQTTTVDNLVDDLQNDPALSSAITMMGLSDWVGQLQLVNNQLDDAYIQRMEDKGDMPSDKIKDLRTEGNDLYYQLRDMLMAQALVAGYVPPFEEAINKMNIVTTEYNNILARRQGNGEDDTGDEDPELPV